MKNKIFALNNTGDIFKHLLFFLLSYWALACQHLLSAPVITSISPPQGQVTGGNVVMISGSGFSLTTNVDFGSRPAGAFTVLNDSSISAIVPAGTPGTVDVRVTSTDQSPISRNDFYTYTASGWQGIISTTAPDQVAFFSTDTHTLIL